MPRYFIDTSDGAYPVTDRRGHVLSNDENARQLALAALADMVRDVLRERSGAEVVIRIRDGADGPVVLAVTLTTELPLTSESP